ncbi:MAG: cation acetate symporter [Desulfobulbaceae bacterium]|uniref:Cation acetate symporter n=1 Tax=Candidatus Desulfatifera sulfidica TaxID=2841691 RepID=A0A8J6NBA8_9BACT|nr:cation acetate symporter [Candidatus Desulfatifera sulfidica]
MDLKTMTYLVVGATFALYIFIAIRSRAKSTAEFYVAGKGVHPVLNGMATGADWMSAASFISMAGLIAFNGYDASVYLMGWTGGYVLLAMLLAPYLRKYGKFTVPAFIGDRFYSNTARIVAVICLITASITYVIGQMKGIGVAFSRFLEVDFSVGLMAGMVIVFIYAVLGGMKGVTNTQIAQYCVLIFAYTVPAIFISLQLTGNFLPQLGLGSMMADGSGVYLLDKLDKSLVDLGFSAYTSQKGSTLNMFLLTLSLMIGTAGLPHVIMRFFTVPKVRDARFSAGWALVFIAILYTTAPAVGAMARLNLMDTIQVGEIGSPEGNLKYEERPQWFKNWEKTGLLKFEDKNNDGRIQYYGGSADFAATAAANGWLGNEMVKVDRDIMVLANPEIAKLPNWTIALVAAGGIAAALSTAAGLLLAISSAVSHDLCKGVWFPDMDDKTELLASRVAMAGAICVAGYLGMNPPGFAAQVVALAFGLAASSLFPVIMLGIFDKRCNRTGAIAGMLTGLGSTLVYIFWFKGWFFIKATAMAPDTAANWLFGISPGSFGAVGALLNFAVAIAISRMTEPPPEHIQHLVEDIRVPMGAGGAQMDH